MSKRDALKKLKEKNNANTPTAEERSTPVDDIPVVNSEANSDIIVDNSVIDKKMTEEAPTQDIEEFSPSDTTSDPVNQNPASEIKPLENSIEVAKTPISNESDPQDQSPSDNQEPKSKRGRKKGSVNKSTTVNEEFTIQKGSNFSPENVIFIQRGAITAKLSRTQFLHEIFKAEKDAFEKGQIEVSDDEIMTLVLKNSKYGSGSRVNFLVTEEIEQFLTEYQAFMGIKLTTLYNYIVDKARLNAKR